MMHVQKTKDPAWEGCIFCLQYLVLIKKERSKSVSLSPFDTFSIRALCEENMKIAGQKGVLLKNIYLK